MRFFAVVLAALTIATPIRAQITKQEYAARRDSVAARIHNGVVLAFGAREPADDLANFRQLPGFAYLTGVNEFDAAFVMVARDGRVQNSVLLLHERDPRLALYNGFLPSSAEVQERYGLKLRTMDQLAPLVDSLLTAGLQLRNVPDVASRDFLGDSLTLSHRFLEQLQARRAGVAVTSAQAMLDSLRVRKSPAEIALLRRAIDVTMRGHVAAMRAVAPGRSEADAQAEADRTFRVLGDGTAFGGIVGSGPNATSYHYRANNRPMRDGELVVMDMGAIVDGYVADVTRTIPVNGRFTPEQRRIYEIVLESQREAEKVARAGARVALGDSVVRAVHAKRLTELGLIESPEATFDPPWATNCERRPLACKQVYLFMAHGLGHGIGLEVHDVGGYSYSPTGYFHVGEVFTIEPGLYISTRLLDMLSDTPRNRAFIAKVRSVVERYNNIGVRIEDDYLITPTGLEHLSAGPREIRDIEALMTRTN